jgi:protein-tyrosine phosphatase
VWTSWSRAVIATSGPSGTYPQRAYRNPLDSLVKFLDSKHGEDWAIWEFRAEGTGYPDSEVYNRVYHYPFPDHHPPPFALIPNIMASMRNWLHEKEGRVVVVHCKAGKGRSGTASCSYLISEEGWAIHKALNRFTERRMRPNMGKGVSIPSQLRWIGYVDRWAKHGKLYVERQVEVMEVHCWGLRDGVKIQ